jgi:cell division protein FtsB
LPSLGEAFSISIASCIIAYCVMSFIAGQAGLLAYRDLSRTIVRMEKKAGELAAAHKALLDMQASLAGDPDRIAREARQIGYLRPGEKIITLNFEKNRPPAPETLQEFEAVKAGRSTGLPDELLKTLAGIIGLAVFVTSLFMSLGRATVIPLRTDRS